MTNYSERKEYYQKYYLEHREKSKEYMKQYHEKRKDYFKLKSKEYREKTQVDYYRHETERILAYSALGNQCKICGNADSWVLEIDHIIPIRKIKGRGRESYERVLKGNTNNLQLLCANCHKRKTILEQMNNWRIFTLD